MRERKQPVAAFRVTALCETCGEELEHLWTLRTAELRFMHRCKNGHDEMLEDVYPRVTFV